MVAHETRSRGMPLPFVHAKTAGEFLWKTIKVDTGRTKRMLKISKMLSNVSVE